MQIDWYIVHIIIQFYLDIPHDSYTEDSNDVQTHTFTKFPPTAEDEDEETDKSEVVIYIQTRITVCSHCFIHVWD